MDSNRIGLICLRIVAVIAWLFSAATAGFTVNDTAALSSTSISYLPLTAAAAVFELLSLGSVPLFAILSFGTVDNSNRPNGSRTYTAIACVIVSITALGLAIASFILLGANLDSVIAATPDWWFSNTSLKCIVWGLSGLFQGVMFIGVLLIQPRDGSRKDHLALVSGPRDSVISDAQQPAPPMSLQDMSPPFVREMKSPKLSRASSQSFESFRSSIQNMVRPVTSRTRLVSRSGMVTRGGSVCSESSVDKTSQADGFDAWDTSSVGQHFREALSPSAPSPTTMSGPSRGTALDPIPGSRPVSPAKPLDGPFPDAPIELEEDEYFVPYPPSVFTRPASPALREAHIHPLFRTDSPTPPPAATPGTVIIAAHQAGQVIPRPLSRGTTNENMAEARLRSNSHTASPSPLTYS